MANTQTSVPAFTAGQVLTAAQMTEVNTGIPVFATTVTRDAAFGGTGEKTLAEGQFAYIEATNTTQYYDGSTWQTLVTGGLTYITGATFTTASTVIADGCFTSTYRNYMIFIDADTASGIPELRFYFRTSGADNTSATYYTGLLYGGSATTATATYAFTQTSGQIGYCADIKSGTAMTIFAPQVAIETAYNSQFYANSATTAYFGVQNGFFNNTTQFDGIKFYPASSTITGQYRIYGLANS